MVATSSLSSTPTETLSQPRNARVCSFSERSSNSKFRSTSSLAAIALAFHAASRHADEAAVSRESAACLYGDLPNRDRHRGRFEESEPRTCRAFAADQFIRELQRYPTVRISQWNVMGFGPKLTKITCGTGSAGRMIDVSSWQHCGSILVQCSQPSSSPGHGCEERVGMSSHLAAALRCASGASLVSRQEAKTSFRRSR